MVLQAILSRKTNKVKVLLDNCILTGAELADRALKEKTIVWGDICETISEPGYKKKNYKDASYQKEVDALVTIGRLIREGTIEAFTYSELDFESFRRSSPLKEFNALNNCPVSRCAAPIERSKFRKTIDFSGYVSKGGKKDKQKDFEISEFSQVSFVKWLLQLHESVIRSIVSHHVELGLTDFEVKSFEQLKWFKFVCRRSGSSENYPDVFHLWAAERNGIDVFLTLEQRLPNIVNQIKQSNQRAHQVRTSVLRPVEFLTSIGIDKFDDPPIEAGKFYSFMDGTVDA